jgi:hypothetical protein
MPIGLTGYHVFLSWQDGLEDEREIFFKTVTDFNYQEGARRGIVFIPKDWRTVRRGLGRAQELINEELCKCDYLIILFWCRWGTPPEGDGSQGYTSGTEEEYGQAVESKKSGGNMKDIIIFFKEVREEQIADAGPQLQKLMEFKEKVKKEALYKEFKNNGEFSELLRGYLSDWLYNLEGMQVRKMPQTSVLDTAKIPEDSG